MASHSSVWSDSISSSLEEVAQTCSAIRVTEITPRKVIITLLDVNERMDELDIHADDEEFGELSSKLRFESV